MAPEKEEPQDENEVDRYRRERGHAKGLVTRLVGQINSLLDANAMDKVQQKIRDLDDALAKFLTVHVNLHCRLEDPAQKVESDQYLKQVIDVINECKDNAKALAESDTHQAENTVVDFGAAVGGATGDAMATDSHGAAGGAESLGQESPLDLPNPGSNLTYKTSTPKTYLKQRPSFGSNLEASMCQSIVEAMQLPKTDLPEFDGDPLQYWSFIRAFENLVDKDTVSDSAKLMRLMNYTTGRVNKLLQCCLVKDPSEGYTLAKRLLRERFGNQGSISQAWINKLLNHQKVSDNRGLMDYADELRCGKETLETMGYLNEINNQTSLLAIIEKLPRYLQTAWLSVNHDIKKKRNPQIGDVIQFITKAAERAADPVFGKLAEISETEKKTSNNHQQQRNNNKKSTKGFSAQVDQASQQTQSAHRTQGSSRSGCYKCGANHFITQCEQFRALKVKDRIEFVKSKKMCLNCLKPGHLNKDCTRGFACDIDNCGQKHNRYLHIPRTTHESQPQGTSADPAPETAPVGAFYSNTQTGRIALPIVAVRVRGKGYRTYIDTYALLDAGSNQTFISEKIARGLGLQRRREKVYESTIATSTSLEVDVVNLNIATLDEVETHEVSNVIVKPQLNIGLTSRMRDEELEKWTHLKSLHLPNVNTNDVHILIGQDQSDLLMPLEVKSGKPGTPYAVRSAFGWAINGPISTTKNSLNRTATSHYTNTNPKVDESLSQQVEKFWKLEDVGQNDTSLSLCDKRVLEVWDKSVKIDENHYTLDIPFKSRPPMLPDNKQMAEHRLKLLGKRLEKDAVLKKAYVKGINSLLEKGYAEPIPDDDPDVGCTWYLPHHPVLHPRKPGKVRIVFDCAAKYRGMSLNDNVMQGPDLTNKLVGVLLRFRQGAVAVMGDIEGMFHQVKVTPSDRDVLRFLWWKDDNINTDPVIYRMTAHLFGGVWSPSCSNFALRKCASDQAEKYDPETVATVIENFYVDDCLKSTDTTAQAIHLTTQLRSLLSNGGFRLTKFLSNSREVMQSIPEEERAASMSLNSLALDEELPAERALGVLWDVESDCFSFKTDVKDKPFTKRGLLSLASSIYDPMGFVSPFTLKAKMIFQSLCRNKIGWDDPLPEDLLHQWKSWLNDVPYIQEMKIPRCFKPEVQVHGAELHHFSDASENGYGAVSYIRLLNEDKQPHVSLLVSKAKLAPLKTMSIPRLELAAAVESTRLDTMLRKELQIPIERSIFWTDSMIVLYYINNSETRYQTFIANRVSAIQNVTDSDQWRHVSTDDNPGDDTSRGLTASDLVASQRWKLGPNFLWLDEDSWPTQPIINSSVAAEAETKPDLKVYHTAAQENHKATPLEKLIPLYSDFNRLKRAVAWILRLKDTLLKKTKTTGMLTMDELERAETALVLQAQQTFVTEPNANLNPIKNNDGVLCVGGRLSNAPIPEDAKHPVLLPASHHLSVLIVHHCHEKAAHAGIERTLSDIRQRFWIIKGRILVKRIIHECIPCRKMRRATQTQQMADLPVDRVIPNQPPFYRVGVDYFGPFLVKRARSEVKRWGCLFTCLSCRAIHIEVACSLDTDSFINALQRFIARRGEPTQIRSDNGTNFVGAKQELANALQEIDQSKVDRFCSAKNIQWTFNPPAASHMGGVWERQIRSVRSVLHGLSTQQKLDDESLHTLLCIAESIVNGRPITKLSDDPKDPMPLTPNHLLLLRSGKTESHGSFVPQDQYRRRWRQVQYLADLFWHRWLKEYLPTLQLRHKWIKREPNLKIGDLVLVKSEVPRYKWPLALVLNPHVGKDGLVRSVQLKTTSGIYVRPINKICLLEGAKDQDTPE